jgi:hypothetical protein
MHEELHSRHARGCDCGASFDVVGGADAPFVVIDEAPPSISLSSL